MVLAAVETGDEKMGKEKNIAATEKASNDFILICDTLPISIKR